VHCVGVAVGSGVMTMFACEGAEREDSVNTNRQKDIASNESMMARNGRNGQRCEKVRFCFHCSSSVDPNGSGWQCKCKCVPHSKAKLHHAGEADMMNGASIAEIHTTLRTQKDVLLPASSERSNLVERMKSIGVGTAPGAEDFTVARRTPPTS
jgi:hypothetical protein